MLFVFTMFIYVLFVHAYLCIHIKLNIVLVHEIISSRARASSGANQKPGHHINVKVIMFSQEHVSLVQGQLSRRHATKPTVAMVSDIEQRVRDQEFLMNKSWTELGGGDVFIIFIFLIFVYC